MNASFEKAMKLAVLSGLKIAMGPAFLRASQRSPEARSWTAVALGEMVLDKTQFISKNRSSLPLLIPHAIAGGWVARECQREEGVDDPMTTLMGAAVAAGVATIAPLVRSTAYHVLGVPSPVLGLVEDYLSIKLGMDAVGISFDQVAQVAQDSVEDLTGKVMAAIPHQSVGAGSM